MTATFTPEDGTGLVDANAFYPTASVDDYFSLRGDTVWAAATSADKEAAVIAATDYIIARWGVRYRGTLKSTDQALPFPRDDIYDANGKLLDDMPPQLLAAVALYARAALGGDLAPAPTVDASGQQVAMKLTRVGPIMTQTQYTTTLGVSQFKAYPLADSMIEQLLAGGGIQRVIRN